MNFQTLIKVENPDFFLDIAFRNAKNVASKARSKLKGTRLEKSKKVELERIDAIKKSINKSVGKILESFPDLEKLPVFYFELLKASLDYVKLKKSLGAVNWAIKKVNDFSYFYKLKIKKTMDLNKINDYRREFYGRTASALKQIKNELFILEDSRKIMKNFPVVKTSVPTVVMIGFPNVGKTTLLFKLTGSKPEINSYVFTTKSINIAYLKKNSKKIQLIDTPGTLNRFNKMNNIEKQAYLAIKHCANLIVYIFDPTESYPLKDQKKLLLNLKMTKKPIVTYLSKSDVVGKDVVDDYKKKFKTITNLEVLKEEIMEKA